MDLTKTIWTQPKPFWTYRNSKKYSQNGAFQQSFGYYEWKIRFCYFKGKHEKPTHTCGKPEKSDQDSRKTLQESNNNDSKSATEEFIDFTSGFHGFESNANIAIDEGQATIDPLHDQNLMPLKG